MNRFDAMLLAGALVFSAGLFFAQHFSPRHEAARVMITRDGILLAELPLNRDDVYTIADGDNFVEVAVEGGAVFVSRASCRDQLCVRRGRISAAGQSTICLPNRVAAVVTGGDESSFDAVLY